MKAQEGAKWERESYAEQPMMSLGDKTDKSWPRGTSQRPLDIGLAEAAANFYGLVEGEAQVQGEQQQMFSGAFLVVGHDLAVSDRLSKTLSGILGLVLSLRSATGPQIRVIANGWVRWCDDDGSGTNSGREGG